MAAIEIRNILVLLCIVATNARSPPPMQLPVVSPGRGGPIVNIADLGARGDGISDCTAAFKEALAMLQLHSGGVLLVPREDANRESVFTTLPLQLNVSNLTLRIETGARILARCDINAWPVEAPWPSFEAEGLQYMPFIKVSNVTDFVAEGGGFVDGNGSCFWNANANGNRLPHLRPRNFVVTNSRRVDISGLTVGNSGFWNLVMHQSQDVHIHDVTIINPSGGVGPCPQPHGQPCYGPNADGIDLVCVERAVVEDSVITAGDDCVCIKSGYRHHVPTTELRRSANILVRNITVLSGSCPHVFHGFGDGCGAFKIGTEMAGGVENVIFEDSRVEYAGIALKVSAPIPRGGHVRNITFRNISVARTGLAIAIQNGDTGTATNPDDIPLVEDIFVEDVHVANVSCGKGRVEYCGNLGWLLSGASKPLETLTMRNVTVIAGGDKPQTWKCENTHGVETDVVPPATCLKERE